MSDKDEDVFLDTNVTAEDDDTPRRSTRVLTRKRRSTAGSTPQPSTSSKKAKSTKMPLLKSPSNAETPTVGGAARGNRATAPLSAGQMLATGQMPAATDCHDDFWTRMTTMLGGTEARMTTRIEGTESRLKAETAVVREALENKLDGEAGTVEDLKKRMAYQENRLSSLEGNIYSMVDERIAAKIPTTQESLREPEEIEEVVHRAWGSPKRPTYATKASAATSLRPLSSAPASKPLPVLDPAKRKDEAYWKCRRSVRIRPIEAKDVASGLKSYLRDFLKLSEQSIDALGLERSSVERIPYGPKSKHQKEVVVCFPSTEARDVVKGAARNLANLGPEYGVRLEIPNHMKSAMQALQTVSYDIKQKHPGARRNVLFDDAAQELVLDFSTAEGQPWKRISTRQAKQAKSRRKKGKEESGRDIRDGELDVILGLQGGTSGCGESEDEYLDD